MNTPHIADSCTNARHTAGLGLKGVMTSSRQEDQFSYVYWGGFVRAVADTCFACVILRRHAYPVSGSKRTPAGFPASLPRGVRHKWYLQFCFSRSDKTHQAYRSFNVLLSSRCIVFKQLLVVFQPLFFQPCIKRSTAQYRPKQTSREEACKVDK